jgi:hypothetical protein
LECGYRRDGKARPPCVSAPQNGFEVVDEDFLHERVQVPPLWDPHVGSGTGIGAALAVSTLGHMAAQQTIQRELPRPVQVQHTTHQEHEQTNASVQKHNHTNTSTKQTFEHMRAPNTTMKGK